MEVLEAISRMANGESLQLCGNHLTLDFTCSDLPEIDRNNAMIFRSIREGCKKYLDSAGGCDLNPEVREAAKLTISNIGSV
jgi:hypothetical protein